MMLVLGSFAFKNRPPILVKYRKIRKPLLVVGIVLQYYTIRIKRFELLDQLRLELALLLHLKRSFRIQIVPCHKTKGSNYFLRDGKSVAIVTVLWQDKRE